MTTKNTTGTPGADAKRLRTTIENMDAIGRDGFSRIEALARVTLLALETPDAYRFTGLIAQTLDTIAMVAQGSRAELEELDTEEIGCWVALDASRQRQRASRRRLAARCAAVAGEVQGAGGVR